MPSCRPRGRSHPRRPGEATSAAAARRPCDWARRAHGQSCPARQCARARWPSQHALRAFRRAWP
eukprot:1460826-Pleurochrysis_carterae.AAC.3